MGIARRGPLVEWYQSVPRRRVKIVQWAMLAPFH
jgi:hypothetical protein